VTPPPAAVAAPTVRPRRPLAPRGPRRVSGPARRAPSAQPARSRRRAVDGSALGLISVLESLAQHRMLDRLIRGRTWIGIVAFALIGIVTLQLGLLKLNGGIGRALEHEAVLQRENAALSIENSELAAGTRVETRAARLGMSFVPAGSLHFLSSSSRGDVGKAASALATASVAAASAEAQASAQPSESSEAVSGSEASGETQASAGESSTEGEASSEATSEAPSSESTASAEPGGGETSATATGEAESTASAAETGAGGGIEATSSGG
jgi:hypothetical protein